MLGRCCGSRAGGSRTDGKGTLVFCGQQIVYDRINLLFLFFVVFAGTRAAEAGVDLFDLSGLTNKNSGGEIYDAL